MEELFADPDRERANRAVEAVLKMRKARYEALQGLRRGFPSA
jgi:hypothetical protein